MAYANSLPPIVIKICRWFNAFCLLLTFLVCLDVFLLPKVIRNEKILAREAVYVTTRSKFTGKSSRTQLDNVTLITENFYYPYDKIQGFNPKEADSVKLVTTYLFSIVKTGYVKRFGEEKELIQNAGIFGTFCFLPISFGLIAIVGVAMRNNKEQLLNAAVMNFLLLPIHLWIMGYFAA
ncbi:hypothetical protein K3G39_11875 [Pontibacter sp. HSC-14F20]|uniref:hypothetical protein n=1 Tax=Pontibacter sp. HSC-14F20 TaxID=2864136 RepID=UPI001C73849C|nr:hypothetical protein [Pontibacter sp. HSC-14F20]MBX0333934.1 hypothetical protein [Pontibacter sp. HSC-14F20]